MNWQRNRTGGKSGRRGSALVAVLWLIGILSMAAIAAIRVVAFDVDVVAAQVHGFRARQLAEAGIAVGINPAVQWSGISANSYRMLGVKVLGPDGNQLSNLSAVIANY